jgi:hypothetical protein
MTNEIKNTWQSKFLTEGTANACGDLSIMISVVSEIMIERDNELLEKIEKNFVSVDSLMDTTKLQGKELIGYWSGWNKALSTIVSLIK